LPAAVAFLLVASGAAAPTVAQQPDLVRLAQRVPVSTLDSTFPPISFEHWLAQVGNRSKDAIRWEAVFDLAPDTTAHASLIVAGTDGTPGKPAIWILSAAAGTSVITFTRLPEWVAYVRRHKMPAPRADVFASTRPATDGRHCLMKILRL